VRCGGRRGEERDSTGKTTIPLFRFFFSLQRDDSENTLAFPNCLTSLQPKKIAIFVLFLLSLGKN
jgi:hypothetical protein